MLLDDGSFLFPSGGKLIKKIIFPSGEKEEVTLNENYYLYSNSNTNPFVTRQPMYLRLGLSKKWDKQAILAIDLITGFTSLYGSSSNWQLSIGTEIIRFKNQFLRLGYAFGGISKKSISLGYGIYRKKIHFDVGASFMGGFSMITAKGVNLSASITWEIQK